MVGIVLNDSVIGNKRVTCPCAIYRRLPLKRDSLGDVNVSRPTKDACWQRDRVTVHCLRIVNGLNVCRRTIGLVDGGPGVRSEKTAPKQSTKNGCNSFHKCGLSFLAMRRCPLITQSIFMASKVFCCGHLLCMSRKYIQDVGYCSIPKMPCLFESLLRQAAFLYW